MLDWDMAALPWMGLWRSLVFGLLSKHSPDHNVPRHLLIVSFCFDELCKPCSEHAEEVSDSCIHNNRYLYIEDI